MVLANTIALVTGGASGLGFATVRHLLTQGSRVLAVDVSPGNALLEWAKEQEISTKPGGGPRLLFQQVDVMKSDEVSSALDNIEKTFGSPLNAAINCAGIAPAQKTLSSRSPHDFDVYQKTLLVNTAGTFNVARLAAERMATNEPSDDGLRGCVVNTASIAAYEGQRGQVAYASSKAAVVGMTLPMSRDLASYGIRVVTIVSPSSGWFSP